jgi:hypothetical protein
VICSDGKEAVTFRPLSSVRKVTFFRLKKSGTPMALRFRTLSLGTQNQTQLGKPKALLYRTALFPQFLNRNHDLLPQIEEVAGIRLGRLLFCATAKL